MMKALAGSQEAHELRGTTGESVSGAGTRAGYGGGLGALRDESLDIDALAATAGSADSAQH